MNWKIDPNSPNHTWTVLATPGPLVNFWVMSLSTSTCAVMHIRVLNNSVVNIGFICVWKYPNLITLTTFIRDLAHIKYHKDNKVDTFTDSVPFYPMHTRYKEYIDIIQYSLTWSSVLGRWALVLYLHSHRHRDLKVKLYQ